MNPEEAARADRFRSPPLRGQGRPVQGALAPDPHPHPRGALVSSRDLGLRAPPRDLARGVAPLAASGRAAPEPAGRVRPPGQPRLLPSRLPAGRRPAPGCPGTARRDPRDHAAPARRPRRAPRASDRDDAVRDRRQVSAPPSRGTAHDGSGATPSATSPRGRVSAYVRGLAPAASDYRELGSSWKGDLLAGVTVGIVALPLALAFGVSSGAGAEAGLITAIVAGIVAAVFGG